MTDQELADGSTQETVLVAALAWVMRPLVRLLIARGVLLPAAIEALKRVYVEVAEADFALEGKAVTDSRVSILTGVHRRDVRRLRSAPVAKDRAGRPALVAEVIARWLGDPVFCDAHGRPKPVRLARGGSAARAGGGPAEPAGGDELPTFELLIAGLIRDVRPRTLLDDLRARGVVEEADGLLTLVERAFVPKGDDESLMHYFKHNLHAHAAVAAGNVLAPEQARLEQAVYYNCLSPASIAALELEARAGSAKLLQGLNNTALKLQKADRKDAGAADQMFRFGVYFHADEDGDKS